MNPDLQHPGQPVATLMDIRLVKVIGAAELTCIFIRRPGLSTIRPME